MKAFYSCAAALCFTMVGHAHAIEADKVKHFEISFVLGVAGQQIVARNFPQLDSALIGGAVATVPGIAKELLDERRRRSRGGQGFSGADLAADAAGAFAGAYLSKLVSDRLVVMLSRDDSGGRKLSVSYTVPLP